MEKELGIYGAVIGDICGSIYEWNNRKTDTPEEIRLLNPKCRFTDDTVLTAAVAKAVKTDRDYQKALFEMANLYANVGYGPSFSCWFKSKNPQPYNSFGNGSAMRVSPVGWYFDTEEEVLEEARRSAEPTHNHPEGIKGAQAVALAIFLCRNGIEKQVLKERIEADFGYNLSRKLADIRLTYDFDVSCQGSVPEAIIAFLESTSFASSIRNAISIGGDSDTIACIAGSIAEAYYRFNEGLPCTPMKEPKLGYEFRPATTIRQRIRSAFERLPGFFTGKPVMNGPCQQCFGPLINGIQFDLRHFARRVLSGQRTILTALDMKDDIAWEWTPWYYGESDLLERSNI